MKKYLTIAFALLVVLFNNCTNGQNSKINLSATEFAEKTKEMPIAPIVDVRTPEEFSKGHLQNAKNINWNGEDFNIRILQLNKSLPVFIYCLSGARSSAAASQMRSEGFQEVYELDGGIIQWRSKGFPETKNTSTGSGMTSQQFYSLLQTDKLVLIDFYAQWCAPCKKMKPYLEELSNEMKDKVIVIRIDADDNQSLFKELKADVLPTLLLYKDKKLIWSYAGYVSKEEIAKHLK